MVSLGESFPESFDVILVYSVYLVLVDYNCSQLVLPEHAKGFPKPDFRLLLVGEGCIGMP